MHLLTTIRCLLIFFRHNLLQLISNPTDSASAEASAMGSGGAGAERLTRSLAATPGGVLASLQARMAVLRRLHVFLELLFKYSDHGAGGTMGSSADAADTAKAIVGSVVGSVYIGAGGRSQPKPFRLGSAAASSISDISLTLEPATFKQLVVNDVLPLLLECWIEHNPSGVALQQKGSPMEDLANMKVITDISNVVITRMLSTDEPDPALAAQMRQVFAKNFMVYFPLGETLTTDSNPEMDAAIQAMNVSLADLMTFLLPAQGVRIPESARVWIDRILDYLIRSLGGDNPNQQQKHQITAMVKDGPLLQVRSSCTCLRISLSVSSGARF